MFNHLDGDKKRQAVKNKILNTFPNFPEVSITDMGHVSAHTLDNSRIIISNLNKSWSSVRDRLKPEHRKVSTEKRMMSLYPNLKIRVYFNKSHIQVSVWTKSGTAMNLENDKLSSPRLHVDLASLEVESSISSRDHMFFCTGHNNAEPIEEYEYSYFAGRYCKQYKKDNPGHHINAMSENYH